VLFKKEYTLNEEYKTCQHIFGKYLKDSAEAMEASQQLVGRQITNPPEPSGSDMEEPKASLPVGQHIAPAILVASPSEAIHHHGLLPPPRTKSFSQLRSRGKLQREMELENGPHQLERPPQAEGSSRCLRSVPSLTAVGVQQDSAARVSRETHGSTESGEGTQESDLSDSLYRRVGKEFIKVS